MKLLKIRKNDTENSEVDMNGNTKEFRTWLRQAKKRALAFQTPISILRMYGYDNRLNMEFNFFGGKDYIQGEQDLNKLKQEIDKANKSIEFAKQLINEWKQKFPGLSMWK